MTIPLTTLPVPVVQAPMAGGPSTPALAVAVARAGGLGMLAAGYKSTEAVAEEVQKEKGGKVTVIVSKGPVLVAIPGGLIGKQFTEVKGLLEGLGFTVRERQAIPGINFGTVQGLNPSEGTQAPKGTEIVVTTV